MYFVSIMFITYSAFSYKFHGEFEFQQSGQSVTSYDNSLGQIWSCWLINYRDAVLGKLHIQRNGGDSKQKPPLIGSSGVDNVLGEGFDNLLNR